jgi:hypothetical protein
MNYRLILCLLGVCAFSLSCNYPRPIIARNYSATDREMRIAFPADFEIPNQVDSLDAWDLTDTRNEIAIREVYRYFARIPVRVDRRERTLSFTLKAWHEVTVTSRPTSYSIMKRTKMIASGDTLECRHHDGCWTYRMK